MENVWFPESVYIGWLTYSIVLMTSALFFYHMTRVASLEMHPIISGTAAVVMIIIAIIFVIMAMVVYVHRISELRVHQEDLSSLDQTIVNQENVYGYIYLTLGVILSIVELLIGYSIIRGTVSVMRNSWKFSLHRTME